MEHNKYFPYRKLSKLYYNNKHSLTNAIKESMTLRKEMQVTKLTVIDYITFWRTAEHQYYQDWMMRHIASIRKSWQVIKSTINRWKYCPVNSKFKYNYGVISDGKIIANRSNNFSKMLVNV